MTWTEDAKKIIAATHERDEQALDIIARVLNASEWSPDTLDTIADTVRWSGREVNDVE